MLQVLTANLPRKYRQLIEFIGERAFAWGVLTVVTGLVAFCIDLAFAIALQRFLISIGLINAGSETPLFGAVGASWHEMTAFLGVGVLRLAVMWLNSFATGACQVAFETERRRDIAIWALHSGSASIGEVTSLFNDVVIGASTVVSSSFFIASRTILVALSVATLIWYSFPVTLSVIALVMLAVPIHRVIDRQLNRISGMLQTALADTVSRLIGCVKNAMFIHIHGLVPTEIDRANTLLNTYEWGQRQYYYLASARGMVPQFVGLLAVTGIAYFGSFALGDDRGSIVTYLYLTLRLFQGLSELARISANVRVNRARLSVLRHWWGNTYLPQREHITSHTCGDNHTIIPLTEVGWRLDRVTFGWDSTNPMIREFSIDIRAGTTTVVVGPSGGGKTTFLLLIAGLIEPTSGNVLVLTPEGDLSVAVAKERLLASTAFVGPDPFVLPGTIREFLAFGASAPPSDADIAESLRLAHCHFITDLAAGLDHIVTEQGGGLSAGQKQRLSLARALLRKPVVLLLDEATANLDDETEAAVVATLKELKGKVTIIAVTHRGALRTIADRIVEFGGPTPVQPTSQKTTDSAARAD
ncbi:MAG: ATP-binding cassette domain-containing protein [Hyphomicrobiaceae bacterium]